ncbi:sensor histidine kinase [Nonomuraea sp. NPDC050790]|uniref:sensor histidine kinase n=1 Tax=Nonomuraea sp. NPDC050790 TaxID=3364371 RepID=UPI00379FB7DC
MNAPALRLARLVAVVVSAGFAFGGVIGVVYSEDPAPMKALAFALLTVLFALHLRNCVRRADGRRPTGWPWTLAVQVALTGAGLLLFPATWYGNTGFLAAAVLLLFRRPWPKWGGFALVLAAQFASTMTVRPAVSEALYVALGQTAFVGIALYGVVRLTDLIADLRGTQAGLAAAVVARERLTFAEELNERVGAGLEQVVRHGEAVLEAADQERARHELDTGLNTARLALTEVRSVSHTTRQEARSRPVAADLTTRVASVLVVVTILLMIVPRELRQVALAPPSPHLLALFGASLALVVGLHLRACLRTDRYWPWVLAALVLVTYLPSLALGPKLWYVAAYLPGAVLALVPGRVRWPIAAAAILGDLYFHATVTGWADNALDVAYGLVYVVERALIVYALWRMARLADRIQAARIELARVEVARERLRFARDLHDLLGYGLSVVVLKAELAVRLLGRDPAAARRELADGLAAARQVLSDIDSVASGYSTIALADEVASARSVLAAAGVELSADVSARRLPDPQDAVLATVLREAVTNVLRHSDARHGTLVLAVDGETAGLRLANDGVRAVVHEPGSGLGNLRERVEALGGELSIESAPGTFALAVVLPLEPALVGGDPDRVHPVTRVELHDG